MQVLLCTVCRRKVAELELGRGIDVSAGLPLFVLYSSVDLASASPDSFASSKPRNLLPVPWHVST